MVNNNKEEKEYKTISEVAKELNLPTSLMTVFFIVPTFIRNWVYDYVAKNRYKWYGKKEACMIPTPELILLLISLIKL